jgi:hypothetical protein
LLRAHDAVVPVNEPLIGWYLGPFLCDLPGGDADALDTDTFTLRRVQHQNGSSFFAEQFSHVWVPALGSLIRERMYVHARVHVSDTPHSKRLVVIKEPNGSQSADVLMQAVPRSRLLFLLRDGRDVVDSELAANLEGSWVTREFPGLRGIPETGRLAFVIQSAHKWLWRTEVVQQALAAHRGPARTVRYEDLVARPEAELMAIFEWLGLQVGAPDVQTWVQHNSFEAISTEARGEGEFFRSATPGAWRRNLREDEQSAIQRIIGPKLAELGYD